MKLPLAKIREPTSEAKSAEWVGGWVGGELISNMSLSDIQMEILSNELDLLVWIS